jgi:hypothetical protein
MCNVKHLPYMDTSYCCVKKSCVSTVQMQRGPWVLGQKGRDAQPFPQPARSGTAKGRPFRYFLPSFRYFPPRGIRKNLALPGALGNSLRVPSVRDWSREAPWGYRCEARNRRKARPRYSGETHKSVNWSLKDAEFLWDKGNSSPPSLESCS